MDAVIIPIDCECQSSWGACCFSDELTNDVPAAGSSKNRHDCSTIPEQACNVGRLEVIGYDSWFQTSHCFLTMVLTSTVPE